MGLAYAGAELGVPVTVCVPRGNNPEKNEAIRGFGATLIEEGRRQIDIQQLDWQCRRVIECRQNALRAVPAHVFQRRVKGHRHGHPPMRVTRSSRFNDTAMVSCCRKKNAGQNHSCLKEWEGMGRNGKTLDFSWWLQLSKRQILSVLPVS